MVLGLWWPPQNGPGATAVSRMVFHTDSLYSFSRAKKATGYIAQRKIFRGSIKQVNPSVNHHKHCEEAKTSSLTTVAGTINVGT